jgi:ribosomal-protein-alanine N-acetyltransferase
MPSSHTPYVIQPMTLADVPAVTALEKTVFSLPWSRHAFEHEVQHNPMAHFLVLRQRPTPCPAGLRHASAAVSSQGHNAAAATFEGTSTRPVPPALLGYGGFWLIIDEAHICTLAVHPEWRGRGLGQLLLVHLVERAVEAQASYLTLEVRATNSIAQLLYTKYGFARVGRRKGYYTDTGEDAIIMTTDRISSAAYQDRFQKLKAVLFERLAEGEGPVAEAEQGSPHGRQQERTAG